MNKLFLALALGVALTTLRLRGDIVEDAIEKNDVWQVKNYTETMIFTPAEKSRYLAYAHMNVLKCKPTLQPRLNMPDALRLALATSLISSGMHTCFENVCRAHTNWRFLMEGFAQSQQTNRAVGYADFSIAFLRHLTAHSTNFVACSLMTIGSALIARAGFNIVRRYFKGDYTHQPYVRALAIETLIYNVQSKV